VDQRKTHRATIEQIGQILSIAGIGGWTLLFQFVRAGLLLVKEIHREKREPGRIKISGKGGIKLGGRSRAIFPDLPLEREDHREPVDRTWAVSSGGGDLQQFFPRLPVRETPGESCD